MTYVGITSIRPSVRPSVRVLVPEVKPFFGVFMKSGIGRLCKNLSKISGLSNFHAFRKDVNELLPTAFSYFLTDLARNCRRRSPCNVFGPFGVTCKSMP